MANISNELKILSSERYAKNVRSALYTACTAINSDLEKGLATYIDHQTNAADSESKASDYTKQVYDDCKATPDISLEDIVSIDLSSGTKKLNGITRKYYDSHTYIISGTSTDVTTIEIGSTYGLEGEYKLIGCPEPSENTLYVKCVGYDILGNQMSEYVATDIEGLNTFTSYDAGFTYKLYIVVAKDRTFTDPVIIRPRLTKNLNATYADFIPYDKNAMVFADGGKTTLDDLPTSSRVENRNKVYRVESDIDSETLSKYVTTGNDERIRAGSALIANKVGRLMSIDPVLTTSTIDYDSAEYFNAEIEEYITAGWISGV